MRTSRWPEVDRLIHAALDKPAADREAFIEDACKGDSELREEVRSLWIRYENDSQRITTVVRSGVVAAFQSGPEIPSGYHLSKYEILSRLGRGGMGDVYLAKDMTLGRNVALKILLPGVGELTGASLSVFKEARAASSLNHVNVMTVFDAGEVEGRQFIAAEYVRGVTLRERMSAGPLKFREAVSIAIQVASALAAAHSAGVVHRDIKPENVMLRPDGIVKVLDFGIAKFRESLPYMGGADKSAPDTAHMPNEMIIGSLPYMSPEQARGKRVDNRSDIFSFGALLYELVSGIPAFSGGSNLSTLLSVVNHRPVVPHRRNLPRGVQKIIDCCLEKDPEERPQNIEEVKAALEKLRTRRESVAAGVKWVPVLLAVGGILAAVVIVSRPRAVPRNGSYVQRRLTHDGAYKEPVLASDGSSIFFDKIDGGKNRALVQLSLIGYTQSSVLLPGSSADDSFEIQDYSSRVGDLLLRRWSRSGYANGSFLVVHLPDVSRSDLPRASGYSGAWSPDGSRIAYIARDLGAPSAPPNSNWALFVSTRGGAITKLSNVSEPPKHATRSIAWSSDDRIWFMQNERLFEVSLANPRPRPVFQSEGVKQGPGKWTSDGSRYIFSDTWTQDLWAFNARSSTSNPEMSRLTSGPIQFGAPALSADGQKIYAVGQLRRGHLSRFDRAKHTWRPLLDGASADALEYSSDGNRMAFVSYPEGELWISKADGTEREQITREPMHAYMPRFSPDGSEVAFMGRMPGDSWRVHIYSERTRKVLPVDTGTASEATPGWSPDGLQLCFAPLPWDVPAEQRHIHTYNPSTGKDSILAGSEGLFSPRWSPDGKKLAALRFTQFGMNQAVLFDPETRAVVDLGVVGINPVWSRDSSSIYLLTKAPLRPATVVRIPITSRVPQVIAEAPGRITANSVVPSQESMWMGLAPDESPVVLEDVGNREIYEIALGQQP